MPGHDGVYCIVSDGKLDCSIQGLNMLSTVGTYTGRLRPRGLASSPLYNIFGRNGTPLRTPRQWKSTLSLALGSCYGKSWLELTLHFAYLSEVYSSVIWAIFQLPCDHFPCFVFVFTYLWLFFRSAHAYGAVPATPLSPGCNIRLI